MSEAGDNNQNEQVGASDNDGSTDSEEERIQLNKRLTPVHNVDVSSLAELSIWSRLHLAVTFVWHSLLFSRVALTFKDVFL